MKQTDHVWHLILARVEKPEVIQDNTASKSYLPQFIENYDGGPQCEHGYQRVKVEKFSQQAGSSLASWKADKYSNRQESNESWQPKFYKGRKFNPRILSKR